MILANLQLDARMPTLHAQMEILVHLIIATVLLDVIIPLLIVSLFLELPDFWEIVTMPYVLSNKRDAIWSNYQELPLILVEFVMERTSVLLSHFQVMYLM